MVFVTANQSRFEKRTRRCEITEGDLSQNIIYVRSPEYVFVAKKRAWIWPINMTIDFLP
jgi:hypothetical protein